MSNPFFPPQGQPAYGQPPAQPAYGQPQGYPPPPAQYGQPPAYGQPQGPGPYGQPQGYYGQPQGGYGAPAAPPPPPVQGNLAGFDAQPTGGNGPGIKFTDANGQPAPLGTTRTMVVKRDVRDSDVQQDRQPAAQGGAPKVRRDGSPQWVLVVPVYVQPDADYPEGNASLYVRSGIRDALVEAYGGDLRPKEGDVIQLTLTKRETVKGAAIPKNYFAAQVTRNGQPLASAPAPAQAPPAPPAPAQAPPAAQWAPPAQPEAAPQWTPPAPQGPPQEAQPPAAPQAQPPAIPPAQAVPGPVQGLPPMDPAQLALLERLRGGGQQ